MIQYNSDINLGQIAAAVSLLMAVVIFIIKEIIDSKREIRSANRDIYQKLELASIDLFRFDAQNINYSGVLWTDGKGIPAEQDKRYAYLNYVCQILNLFEMSVRFRKERIMPAEVFGSWIIWYYDLCKRPNFKPIWDEVKMNYTCELRRIIEKGLEAAHNDKIGDFFDYVALETKSKQIRKWASCGQTIIKNECKQCILLNSNAKVANEQNAQSNNLRELTIEWCKSVEEVKEIAAFFSRYKNIKYISHGEVQDGRTVNFSAWRPDIENFIFNDFNKALTRETGDEEFYLLAHVRDKEDLIGFCFLMVKKKTDCPFIEIQDFLIKPDFQRRGIGNMLLEWIENNLRSEGLKNVFLESGADNHEAHSFFSKKGYSVCSKVFFKEI